MDFLSHLFSASPQLRVQRAEALLVPGDSSSANSLTLSIEQALRLIENENDVLSKTGRVDFEGQLLHKLIAAFHDSPFIPNEDYEAVLAALTELFYETKNELADDTSDELILHFMEKAFHTDCGGSLDLLANKALFFLVERSRLGQPLDITEPEDSEADFDTDNVIDASEEAENVLNNQY